MFVCHFSAYAADLNYIFYAHLEISIRRVRYELKRKRPHSFLSGARMIDIMYKTVPISRVFALSSFVKFSHADKAV